VKFTVLPGQILVADAVKLAEPAIPKVNEIVPEAELVIFEIVMFPSVPSVRKQLGLLVLLKEVRPDSRLKKAVFTVPLTVGVPPGRYTYTSSGGPLAFPETAVLIL